MTIMEIMLAKPQGFCAGVERAIKIVDIAVEAYTDKKIYVYHEIVHNQYVLNNFRSRGVIFVESLDEIPEDSIIILSAHGVSIETEKKARAVGSIVIDATCPLVTKVHKLAQKNERENREIILIGYLNHAETQGTSGRVKSKVVVVNSIEDVNKITLENPDMASYITQTTLSIDDTREIIAALKEKFPKIVGPELNDICYATQNRQNAVKDLAPMVDLMLVVGGHNSSNSNRLREIAQIHKVASYLITSATNIKQEWLKGVKRIGITSGASTPEILVQQIIELLRKHSDNLTVTLMPGKDENVHFALPKELYKKGMRPL